VRIVMISRTALAGAPYEAMKCLNKYSELNVRWIAIKTSYADGRVFPCDLLWMRDRSQCLRELKEADIVHIHNEPCPWIMEWITKKRLLVQFHSCPKRNNYPELRKLTNHCYTLYQPLQRRVYAGMEGLPNLIDPEQLVPVKDRNRGRPIIVFAPTNAWLMHQIGSKASAEVMSVLQRMHEHAIVDVFSNLSYQMNLLRKQRADIIIDDVVGETFHRTSLEGACFGLAVLTSYDYSGFMYTRVQNLEKNLLELLKSKSRLREYQVISRNWIMNEWHPRNMVGMYVNAYRKVLHGGN
jgi:hypothetical protein